MDRRFVTLFIIVLIDLIGFGIVIPILPLYAESAFGAGDIQVTMLVTAFSAGRRRASLGAHPQPVWDVCQFSGVGLCQHLVPLVPRTCR